MIPLKTWTNGTPENNYQDGTQLDAADFESWHKEWLALLTDAGIVADATKFDQLLVAIKKLSLVQAATAFTSAGAAPNFTLTPVPALAAYAAGVRYRVKFNAAGNGADTLNVSGLGAKSIKQYNSTGAKVAAVIAAGQLADVEYDGVDFVMLAPLPSVSSSAAIRGSSSNLRISYTGTSGVVAATADELVLESGAGAYLTLRNVNLSATSGNASGVINSLDAGAWAFSTFYYLFVAYNPTTQTAGLLWSLSQTTPTLPAGYTHWARIGGNKTQAATNYWFLGGVQAGRKFQYKVATGSNVSAVPIMASGTAGNPTGTPTWVAVSIASFVLPSASRIQGSLFQGAGAAQAIAAPNNSYGSYSSMTNPPPVSSSSATGTTGSIVAFDFALELASIYWAANGTAVLACTGWEDNL